MKDIFLHNHAKKCAKRKYTSDSPAFLENILTGGPAGGAPMPGPSPMLPIGAFGNVEGGGGGGLL